MSHPPRPRDWITRTANRIHELSLISLGRDPGMSEPFPRLYAGLLDLVEQQARTYQAPDLCKCLGSPPKGTCMNLPRPWTYTHGGVDGERRQHAYIAGGAFRPMCPEKIEYSLGVLLGKGDICLFTSSSDELWSSHLRADLHKAPGIRSIQPVPCLRLIDAEDSQTDAPDLAGGVTTPALGPPRGALQDHPRSITDNSMFDDQTGSVVSFTATQLQETGERPRGRTNIGARTMQRATRAVFEIKRELSSKRRELGLGQDPRLEAYLTFTDFQLMFKYEARSFLQASRILDIIRDALGEHRSAFQFSTSTQIVLPFTDPHDVLTRWREHPVDDEIDPFYIGLLLKVKAGREEAVTARILDTLADDPVGFPAEKSPLNLRRHGYWDVHLLVECRSIHRFVHRVIHHVAGTDDILATRVVPYVDLGQTQRQPVTEPMFESFTGMDPVDTRTQRAHPPTDPSQWLDRQAMDMIAQTSWVRTRIQQFELEWARSPLLPRNVTIARLRRKLDDIEHTLREALGMQAGLAEPAATTSEDDLDTSDADLGDTEESDEFSEAAPDLFDAIRESRALVFKCLRTFEALVGLYHERLEGTNIGAVVEPFARMGERAGAMGHITTAIDRLMEDCCGEARDDISYGKLARPIPPESTPLDARVADGERGTRRWTGLSTTTTGLDYQVMPDLHFLQIPVSTKLSARGVLLALPHESAHFIFKKLADPRHDTREKEQVHRQVKDLNGLIYDHLADTVGAPPFYSLPTPDRRLHKLVVEVTADLWAYLIGGPVFALGLAPYFFDTFQRDDDDDLTAGVGPAVLPSTRVSMGLWLANACAWAPIWSDLISPLQEEMLLLDQSLDLTDQAGNPRFREYTLYQRELRPALASLLYEDQFGVVDLSQTILASGFKPGASPLFFDDPQRDTQEVFRDIQDIADRLLYDWEVVLDARPRDILAAGALLQRSGRVDRRSTYPTLRLYMSMLFAQSQARLGSSPPRPA